MHIKKEKDAQIKKLLEIVKRLSEGRRQVKV